MHFLSKFENQNLEKGVVCLENHQLPMLFIFVKNVTIGAKFFEKFATKFVRKWSFCVDHDRRFLRSRKRNRF